MIRPSSIIFFAIILMLVFCYFFTTDLRAQSMRVAEIIYVSGVVKIKTPTSHDWVDAQEGMVVKEGDIIKTEADSKAELAFGEGLNNIINIFPNSQLVISKFEPGLVKLEQGRVFSLVKTLKKGSTFEIRTPTAVAGARGTGWGVNLQDDETEVQGYEQTIYVAGLSDKDELIGLTDLNAGWKTSLLKGKGPEKFLRLTEEEKRSWRRWKEEALDRLRNFKHRERKAAVIPSSKEDKLEKLEHRAEISEHRARILERVERETTRTNEIKGERRREGGGSGGQSKAQ